MVGSGLTIFYKFIPTGIINRGYTGHEHLDAFGIISMNGRVYDPLTAQFFSPDPFVQAPDNWLNYNRYGYCLNNPLKYIDPSGYRYEYDPVRGLIWIDDNTPEARDTSRDNLDENGNPYPNMLPEATIVGDKSLSQWMIKLGYGTHPYDNQNLPEKESDFITDNSKDIGFIINDATQALINSNTTLKIAKGYNLAKTTIFLPLGVNAQASTKFLSAISKTGGVVAEAAPWVSGGLIATDMVTNRQINVGQVYQATVTALSVIPGWGLVVGGTSLAVEGVSYYFTGKGVADNINSALNGGVIYKW